MRSWSGASKKNKLIFLPRKSKTQLIRDASLQSGHAGDTIVFNYLLVS